MISLSGGECVYMTNCSSLDSVLFVQPRPCMAGQAAKKLKRNATTGTFKYVAIGVFALAGYIAGSVAFNRRDYIWITVFSLATVLNLYMILGALKLGVGFDTWQDFFIVTVLGEIFGSVFYNGELVFLAAPGYAMYLGVRAIGNYMQSTTERGEVEMTDSAGIRRGANLAKKNTKSE